MPEALELNTPSLLSCGSLERIPFYYPILSIRQDSFQLSPIYTDDRMNEIFNFSIPKTGIRLIVLMYDCYLDVKNSLFCQDTVKMMQALELSGYIDLG
ncbi:hypothetical protein BLOT_002346 [Blomia tropicalis]|nr:hypothetical protein BLOT_002346 [Blomia tropicalis]